MNACIVLAELARVQPAVTIFPPPGHIPASYSSPADVSPVPGRASVLRDLVAGCTGPGGVRISAFDGSAQDTDTETDLWEGVDAVVLCAGRGGSPRGAGGVAQESCEALVRFVSHKCVLHGKPLVWGWAGAAGEGGAGVEVNARELSFAFSSYAGYRNTRPGVAAEQNLWDIIVLEYSSAQS